MSREQEYVLRTVEERGVRLIRLWFTDVLGQLKSVAISPAELEQVFNEGVQFDGTAIDGFSRVHEADVLARRAAAAAPVWGWRSDLEASRSSFARVCGSGRLSEGRGLRLIKGRATIIKALGVGGAVQPPIHGLRNSAPLIRIVAGVVNGAQRFRLRVDDQHA